MALLSSPNYMNTDREFTIEKQNTHTHQVAHFKTEVSWAFIYLFIYLFIYSFIHSLRTLSSQIMQC